MENKRGKHLVALNKRRALTPHMVKHSEAAVTDVARLKREEEAKNAAAAWQIGMSREKRE